MPEVCTRGHAKLEAKRCSCRTYDMFTWLQSFRVYMNVCSAHSTEMIPKLLAYMSTIIRTSSEYAGVGWLSYDNKLFCKHTSLRRELRQSVINPTIYARRFTLATRKPA